MKKPAKVFILLIVLMATFLGCRKDNLPRATHKGANTMGCKIDGKEWISEYLHFGGGLPDGGYSAKLNHFLLRANAPDSNGGYILIEVHDVKSVGTYKLQEYSYRYALCKPTLNHLTKGSFFTDQRTSGTLTLTRFDTIRHIYSGTFEFEATRYNEFGKLDTTQTISVTQGRFDMKSK